ncbi:hypothetical protein [Mycobacterium sp. 155]|uniref:hypothetical protein n=1 Tax=Mycobacterium sp. 155 TaxID=1157943 RepID=UPI00036389B2|nr:hypothetical protein [Mycobacterium sp. 155]
MTITAEAPAQSHTCPDCLHTARITAVSAGLDPDRLAARVRAELCRWAADDIDAEVIRFGPDHELMVDVVGHEVWEGEWNRSADQQLRLALVHIAAALAAGAKL